MKQCHSLTIRFLSKARNESDKVSDACTSRKQELEQNSYRKHNYGLHKFEILNLTDKTRNKCKRVGVFTDTAEELISTIHIYILFLIHTISFQPIIVNQ